MKAYQELEQCFEQLSHLSHLAAMANWDEAVMMPSGGGQIRSQAMATLSGLMHQQLIDPKIGELLETAKGEALDSAWQQANLKWMDKRYIKATCLPAALA